MPATQNEIEEMAAELRQWYIGVQTGRRREPILPKSGFQGPRKRNYTLKGSKPRKFLQHEKQTFGINLGWTNNASATTARKVARWFFSRKGNNDRPIEYGETIAIGNGGSPSFIRHKKRTIGINLDWSKTPVFEWQIVGGKKGEPVKTGSRVAIYNKKAQECFVYFDRTRGGDIGWPSSRTWQDQAMKWAKKWAEKAVREAVTAFLLKS